MHEKVESGMGRKKVVIAICYFTYTVQSSFFFLMYAQRYLANVSSLLFLCTSIRDCSHIKYDKKLLSEMKIYKVNNIKTA